jgi:hypothetical protein
LGPALVVELVVVADGCLDFIEGFALRYKLLDLSPTGFCVSDSLLDIGFGDDVAVARDEGVGVQGGNSFCRFDPALG